MSRQFFVADTPEFNADPAFDADIGGLEEFFRRGMDEGILKSFQRGNPDGDVPIVVVIVGEHYVDFLVDEKRGLAMRDFFGRAGQGSADSAHARQVVIGGSGEVHVRHPLTIAVYELFVFERFVAEADSVGPAARANGRAAADLEVLSNRI